MGTDISGHIEVRPPIVDDEPWDAVMPLWPLYDGRNYAAFGCLFGVRNWLNWEPVAADRGLPADVTSEVRATYAGEAEHAEGRNNESWVSWADLRDIDMSERPRCRGRLLVHTAPNTQRYEGIHDDWPAEFVRAYPSPLWDRSPAATSPGRWAAGEVVLEYGPVTRLDVIGPGSGWEHVFAVMRALAGRFGDDGVRLVVWFG